METHLFATVRRQVEDKNGKEGDGHTRNDEVDSMEQSLSPHLHLQNDSIASLIY